MITEMSALLGIIHIGTALMLIGYAILLRRSWKYLPYPFAISIKQIKSERKRGLVSREFGKQYLYWSIGYLFFGMITLFWKLDDFGLFTALFAFIPVLVFLIIPGVCAFFKTRQMKETDYE